MCVQGMPWFARRARGSGSCAPAARRRTRRSMASMRCSHFTLAMPYQRGTTRRSGAPCCGRQRRAVHRRRRAARRRASPPPARGCAKSDARCRASKPRSAPWNTISRADSLGDTFFSNTESGTPVHSAVGHALLQPGHRRVARRDLAAAVAGAFQRDAQGLRRHAPQLGETECKRARNQPRSRRRQRAASAAGMSKWISR